MKGVVIIGPFPPPVHGMAKNLKIFYEQIKVKNKAYKIDTSPGTIVRGFRYHFIKSLKVSVGVFKLFTLCCLGKVRCIYLPPDAGFGAWYSLVFVLIARLFEVDLLLHHRSFLYINKKTKAMSLIVKLQSKTTHIFLCERMRDRFCSLYKNNTKTLIVSNAQYVKPIDKVRVQSKKFTIGHLSNLGFEKGIKEVFDVTELLISKGFDVELHLAGPSENSEVENYINQMIGKFGNSIVYHGALYREKKSEFYKQLDCFLFPTTYRNEAQPNVLFEAMSFGVPVFSIDTGCISVDVNCSNGFVISNKNNFVQESTDIIEKLINKPEKLRELKESTLKSIKLSSIKSKTNYKTLLNLVGK